MRWMMGIRSAWKWMQRARVAAVDQNRIRADAGDPAAQYDLGERYHDGLGVVRDRAAALRWFLRAAEQGHAKAQVAAGMMLFLGRGSEPDGAEGVKWLLLAAEGGEQKARVALEAIGKRVAPGVFEEGRRRAAAYQRTSTSP
jgi:TPR repeat protein